MVTLIRTLVTKSHDPVSSCVGILQRIRALRIWGFVRFWIFGFGTSSAGWQPVLVSIGEFPKIRGTLFWVLIIRILLIGVLFWGSPIFGNSDI